MSNKFPKTFYIVLRDNDTHYIPDETMPTVKHYCYGDAMSEAHRLAAKNPGQRFVVLQSMEEYQTNVVVCKKHH